MSVLGRLRGDGLAVRFSILLAVALIAANLVAAGLLYVDRLRQNNSILVERELERIVSLVPAIEAASPDRRVAAARNASTRFSRVSIDPLPIVEQIPVAPRSAALTRDLAQTLDKEDVRAAIMVRDGGERARGRQTVALSIPLRSTGESPQWLNTVSRGERRIQPGIPEEILLLVFSVSLVSVLVAALLVVRRLTRPLNELAVAARLAGYGDRGARVSESGPREIREAAAAFNEMQARIAQFDAERMRTMAAVGHDLRTPITSLRIRAELLDEDDAAPMVRTLDEMAVMAEGLVAFARGAGENEEVNQVDLAALLADLCADRGADFAVAEPVLIKARPVALGRAIGNLVDNALRYGGSARVALELDGPLACITIDDDGPGIPEGRLQSVFEPFVRGEESRNPETGGAGLGLAIAQAIVAAHGGSLTLENRPVGLRARVELPSAPVG